MSLQLQFVNGTLKAAGKPVIRVSPIESELSIPLTVLTLHGNTIDPEIWKTANWWFTFRVNGDFGVEVSEPQEDTGGRNPGSPAGITVRLPFQLLPGFLDLLGPGKDRSFSLELSPIGGSIY
jgi:hypothetical protein